MQASVGTLQPASTTDGEFSTEAELARVLNESRAAMQAAEAGVFEDRDTEHLHDFRVALRRTRALLKLLGHAFESGACRRFRAEFAWLARATGPQRDLDVFLSQCEPQRASAFDQRAVERLRATAQRRRSTARRSLLRALRGARYRLLMSDWFAFLEAEQAFTAEPPVGRSASAHAVLRAYHKLMRRGGRIGPRSRVESLHKLRKNCKELRYLLEAFADLFEKAHITRLTRSLGKLQDVLGRICDVAVQRALLSDLEKALTAEAPSAPTRALLRSWRQSLRKQHDRARQRVRKRFDRVQRKRNRHLFASLSVQGSA